LAGANAIGGEPSRLDAGNSTGGTGIMTPQQELELVWDMLARAMSVIDDLTNLRPPCSRTQQAIDDLIEGIHELEGPQE
jgi:hypothetical protein